MFAGRLKTGSVLSMLMPLAVAGALIFPARSAHVPVADCPAPSVLSNAFAVHESIPDKPSAPVKLIVTSVLFQPLPFGVGEAVAMADGAVLSMLMLLTVVLLEFPARSAHVPVAD